MTTYLNVVGSGSAVADVATLQTSTAMPPPAAYATTTNPRGHAVMSIGGFTMTASVLRTPATGVLVETQVLAGMLAKSEVKVPDASEVSSLVSEWLVMSALPSDPSAMSAAVRLLSSTFPVVTALLASLAFVTAAAPSLRL